MFTTPARIGVGEVVEDTGRQGFADAPLVLPAELTVNAVGTIDDAGAALLRAIDHLRGEFGVDRLDVVAHSIIAGRFFAAADEPERRWPHDGLVALRSARMDEVPAPIAPRRRVVEFGDVHSIFFADANGLDWERALTWDPAVFAEIDRALDGD